MTDVRDDGAGETAGALAEQFQFRMYEGKFPEVDDLVVVNINHIAEMGVYVSLLEYGGIEGMILMSEITRRRIRSINKLLKINRQEVVVVLRVDTEKGYIDLSKRRVTPDDVAKTMAKYTNSKSVHSIMRHVAEVTGESFEELSKNITWPLYKKYLHAAQAFQLALTDPDKAFEGLTMSDKVRKELTENIKKRMTPQPIRMRADIEVMCFTHEGVLALKRALKAGECCGSAETKVTIKLVAPPLYVVLCTAYDKDGGLRLIDSAVQAIKDSILAAGGKMEIKVAPRVVSAQEDSSLATLMENLTKKAEERSSDEEDDEDSEDDE